MNPVKIRNALPIIGHGPGKGPGALLGQKKEKARHPRETLSKLWSYLRRQKGPLLLICFMVCLSTLLTISGPYLMKIAIDKYIIGGVNFSALLMIILIMGLMYLVAAGLTMLQRWTMVKLSQKAIQKLRQDLFHQFQELTIRYFDQHSTGELMSRLTNDIDNISNTLSVSVLEMLSATLSLVGVGIVMVVINWMLGLVCLLVIPLVILLTKQLSKFTRKGFRQRQQHLGNLNGIIEEGISGHRVVKAFAKEEELIKEFAETNQKLQTAAHRANISSGLMGPLMNMMNNLNYGVTAFAGGLLAYYNLASIGIIAAFLSYTRQFSRPLNHVAQLYTSIQSAIAGAERVFDILETNPEFQDNPNALHLETINGQVELKNVYFNYIENIPVLRGINIKAEPGQTIALVGPTGAGKTTIINLLTRFYDYHQGEITIDGKNIHSIRKNDLRAKLGIVQQDTFLFSDSVIENIRYGRLEAKDEEIIQAAKLANAHQFIHRMPKAYDTEISENGANLSQGQRQLIAIARAILSNPSILILDEATSSVDTRTEIHIQEGMLHLMEGRTCFVIAHRLSTIKKADQILVMNHGQIIEEGKHHELLRKQGFYYKLYHSQFREKNPGNR